MSDPSEFLKETIPNVFNEAHGEIREAANKGDAEAKKKWDELSAAAPMAVRVVLEGKKKKDLCVVFEKTELRTVEGVPAGVPVLFAVALPEEALEIALDEMEADVEKFLGKLRKRIPQGSPARTRAGIDRAAQEQMRFHFVMKDTPDFEEVRVKIALGDKEPPEKPTFTVALDYDVFEQLRERKLKAQALVSKLQLSGDSSRAMQLIMQAVQRRSS